MVDGNPEDQDTLASKADFKTMETSLRSSMDTQLGEIHNLIMKLTPPKGPLETSPLEDTLNSNESVSEEEKEKKKRDEETKLKNSPSSGSKLEGGNAEYHAVSHAYSPKPLTPHTRVNPIGPPPKLNALAFTSWKH